MKSPTRISIHEDPGMIMDMSRDAEGNELLNEFGGFTFQDWETEINEDLLQYIHTIAIALESKVIRK